MTAPDAPLPDPAPPSAARARSPLWMRLLLLASLSANLVVVGIVAGALSGRRPAPDGGDPPRDPASAIYFRALPEGQQEAFRDGMRHEAGHVHMDRAALRAELAATLAAIRAEPFEPAALAARIAAQRHGFSQRIEAGDRLLVERVAAMSPAERQAYADRLQQILDRISRWRRD